MDVTLRVWIGLFLICWEAARRVTAGSKLEEVVMESECRDRYLWVHVASTGHPPQFEAVDGSGIHPISDQLGSRCGYTISNFRMDGYTTFRASYYSCYTKNQNDEVFTFNLNIIVTNAEGQWSSHPLSKACSPVTPSQREVICEEDYMEVSVKRDVSCESHQGNTKLAWQTAFSLAQGTATAAWQLMFMKNGDQVAAMSIADAQGLGYSLTTTANQVVFRSRYRQPQSEVVMVDGVPVEIIQASLFFKQKLMVVMIDVSMACTVNSGSFDGARLLWDIPRVMTPLVGEGARFESRSIGLGVEGQLLDQPTASARGFTLAVNGALVQIGVPFGAKGGYRKTLVVDNVYRETYVIFLLYEHIFSLLYEDGSSLETRHRMLRVVDTPLRCHRPFTIDQTINEDHVFSVYLGNIPFDVALEKVKINGERLSMAEAAEHGYSISHVTHINSSQAFALRVPFDNRVVHRTYLGEGVVQYSLDINYTLTIMPQRDSYYHHAFIMAQIHNAFPPELKAECTDEGITFSMLKQYRVDNLWEVGVGQEPLTAELAAQRGYLLRNESQSITLEVPVFSIGYTYEDINLRHFYGTFKLLVRDSKTLEVQTSTSQRCLFKTEEIIVCSADGIMTVVTTPTMTWPKVQPDRTSLLDRTCGPKQIDQSKVLFEFSLNSCGTRVMVGESYVVYENEILHDRQVIADGPAFISRDSQFKLTVRCFYPLSAVNTVFVDNIFTSHTPGIGSIKVLTDTKDAAIKLPSKECPVQVPANTVGAPLLAHQNPAANGVQPPPIGPWPQPGGNHQLLTGSHDSVLGSTNQPFPIINHSAPERQTISSHPVSHVPAPSDHYLSQRGHQHNFDSQRQNSFPSFPPRYSESQDGNVQPSHVNTPSLGFVPLVQVDNPALSFYATNRNPNSPVDHLESSWESTGQGETAQGRDSLGQSDNGLKRHQATLALSHAGSSVGRMDVVHSGSRLNPGSLKTDKSTDSQLPSHDLTGFHQYDPIQMGNMPISQLPADENPLQYGSYQISSGKPYDGAVSNVRVFSRDKKYIPIKYLTSKTGDVKAVPGSSGDTQGSNTSEKNLQGAAQFPNVHVGPPQHIGIKQSNKSTPERSQIDHNQLRTDRSEQNNIQPVQSSVQKRGPQSIRVKSPSIFTTSGDLNQQSINPYGRSEGYSIKQASQYDHSQNTDRTLVTGSTGTSEKSIISHRTETNLTPVTSEQGTSKYDGRDLPIGQSNKPSVELTTAKDSNDENLPTSQQLPEHNGSNSRGEYVPLFQQLIQPAKKPHSTSVTPDVSTGQHGHWPGSTQQKRHSDVIQLAVASHIRVRPAPSKLQIYPGSTARHQAPDRLKHQTTEIATGHFIAVTGEGNGKPSSGATYPSASHYEKPQISNSKGHVSKGALNTKIPSLPSPLNNMLVTGDDGAVQRGVTGPQSSHSHAVEPSPHVSLIKPVSSQNMGTVTIRVKPDPDPGNRNQQPFDQYREPMSSEFNPAPWQSIIQPGDQDVAGPVANSFDFPLKHREPATGHYQSSPRQTEPATGHYQSSPRQTEPATGHYQSSPRQTEPATGHYQSSPRQTEPATGHYQSSPRQREPATGHYQSSLRQIEPATGHYQSSPRQTGPATGHYQSSPRQTEPATGHYQSSPRQTEPATGHYQSSPRQTEPATGHYQSSPRQTEPATGHYQSSPRQTEPATGHYQSSPRPREPPSYLQMIRVRPRNDILQVQNLLKPGNSKQENVPQSTDVSTAANLEVHGLPAPQISGHHTVSIVQPNSDTDASSTGLVSGSFQKPSNFYQQLSQHGQPDEHQSTSIDQIHVTYNVLSTVTQDQVEVTEKCSKGSPTTFLKVSSSPAHYVGSPGRDGQASPRSGQGGLDGMNSAAQLASRLDESGAAPFLPVSSGGHYGTSVHHGIMRGRRNA